MADATQAVLSDAGAVFQVANGFWQQLGSVEGAGACAERQPFLLRGDEAAMWAAACRRPSAKARLRRLAREETGRVRRLLQARRVGELAELSMGLACCAAPRRVSSSQLGAALIWGSCRQQQALCIACEAPLVGSAQVSGRRLGRSSVGGLLEVGAWTARGMVTSCVTQGCVLAGPTDRDGH